MRLGFMSAPEMSDDGYARVLEQVGAPEAVVVVVVDEMRDSRHDDRAWGAGETWRVRGVHRRAQQWRARACAQNTALALRVSCEDSRPPAAHPTSIQCGCPGGEPLYPIETMRPSLTTTAPTCPLLRVLRRATMRAISMKVSLRDGLMVVPAGRVSFSACHPRRCGADDVHVQEATVTPYHVLNSSSSSVSAQLATSVAQSHRHVDVVAEVPQEVT